MNVENRTIFEGDNLHILRGLDSATIDLIYLDPPFNSNRNYSAPIGSEAAGAAFKDTWSLSDVDNAWHGELADREPALYQAIHASEATHGKGMKSYLIMMSVRLLEMRRVLKKTGSIYLHCDPTASHYLKMVMDSVFGKNNFRNDISWKRINVPKSTKNKFGSVHDCLLFYTKSKNSVFNQIYVEYDSDYIKARFNRKDKHGYWQESPLLAAGTTNGDSGEIWKNIDPTSKGKHWVAPRTLPPHISLPENWETFKVREKLDYYDSVGLIYTPPKHNAIPRFKRYLSATKGKAMYCHRKFRPLSNIRLCYNDPLFERSIPMAKRRRFTPKFKAEVVLEALHGESSQAELCRRHNLSENQVSTWKRQLLENVETFFESADKPSSESTERIAQLEQLVGRLTLALEIQKKASTLLD